MTQHTPGPWHVIASAPSLIEAVTAPTSADNNGRRIIAQALDPVPYIGVERILANARLIAAAPTLADLLSACCEYVDKFGELSEAPTDSDCWNVLETSRNLLAEINA